MNTVLPKKKTVASGKRMQKHPSSLGSRPAPAGIEPVRQNVELAKSARADEARRPKRTEAAGKSPVAESATPAATVAKSPELRCAFALPLGCEDLAPVFADASVIAPLNAAQHLHLSELAIRHRATVGEILTALAFSRIDVGMDEYISYRTTAGRDHAITDALLRFVDAGRTPEFLGEDNDIPVELTRTSSPHDAETFRNIHREDALQLAYAAGDADAFERAEREDRVAEALKPWNK